MDEFQKSTQAIANKMSDYLGFEVVEVVDYDFQVEYGMNSFLVKVAPHGPEENGREIEVYQGGYNDLYQQEIFKDEPLVSIAGDDEQALGGATVGFITSL